MLQALVKLKVQGFENPACVGKPKGEIDAFINPSTYKRNYKSIYESSKEVDANAPTQVFKRIGESDLNLSFFVDGTGVMPLGKYLSVDDYIDTFTDLVYGFKGDIHRPYYLLITWGRLKFTGICTSLDVTYNLFTPDGKALRATIDIVLTESIDYKTKAKEAAKSSSDLTHMRIVKAGDTLPLMTYRIYGDSSHYVEVAKRNGLSSFNAIKPGDRIFFHPLKIKS
jgi:hypothetical protein